MYVNPLGYAFYTESDRTVHENQQIAIAIAVVAEELDLQDDWPTQLSSLFPPVPTDEWELEEGEPWPPTQFWMSGRALHVSSVHPIVILQRQIFYANGEAELPASIGRVARAVGCHTARQVKSMYELAFDDCPLSAQTWNELKSVMTPEFAAEWE